MDNLKYLLLLLPILGAFLSRLHGGGFISGVNKSLKNILWALPFGLLSIYAVFTATDNIYMIISSFIISMGLCVVGKATGHGGGMDLAHSPKEPYNGRDPEKLEYLILWLHGRINQYWYDALILAIVGFVSVSGAVLVLSFVNPLAAIVVALGGVLKALSYIIGWAVFMVVDFSCTDDLNEETEIGEVLTGFFAYAGLAIAAYMII